MVLIIGLLRSRSEGIVLQCFANDRFKIFESATFLSLQQTQSQQNKENVKIKCYVVMDDKIVIEPGNIGYQIYSASPSYYPTRLRLVG